MNKTDRKSYFFMPILNVYALAVIAFTSFRLILFFLHRDNITINDNINILKAFVMGYRFDSIICCYILSIPFLLLALSQFIKFNARPLIFYIKLFLMLFFTMAFLICAADIPYFNQFNSRFSVTALEWFDSPVFVFKMIIQEYRYWIFVLPFLFIVYLFWEGLAYSFSSFNPKELTLLGKFLVLIIGVTLLLMGMRGRLDEKSPMRVGTAYFCNNNFLNQLGLNPNFTFIRSYLDSRNPDNQYIHLMDDQLAIQKVKQYLNIKNQDSSQTLSRSIIPDSPTIQKRNVVIVIMESMSAAKMGRYGNSNNLTPFLDSLANKSICFDHCYTAGIHTMNGIFSTLFAYPALYRKHPMKSMEMHKFNGIFTTLKQHNYSTIYFTTHDGQFDNVEGFLKANDCEQVISKSNYPPEKVKTTLGVPDDYLFEYSIPLLNSLHEKGKPFCAAFMTASDHGPYYLPEYFKPRNEGIKKQIVEYADYSLNKFLQLAKQQIWYDNTIFVFVADHGAPMDNVYSLSLDYNHAPLLIFAPGMPESAKAIQDPAGQIDIFPTIMGLLNLPYMNNTLGIDLLKEKRPFIFFNADDKYGVIDQEWLLIAKEDNTTGLYKYKDKDVFNYADSLKDKVNLMNDYAKANIQTYQFLIGHKPH